MNYVNYENMQELFDGIARKIGQGGGSGAGLEDWQPSHEYIEKDICVYEGQIYRAKVGFTSDTTFSTTQILEEYTPVGGETIIPYEKDTVITTGDIVSYDGNDYEALYDFVCGEEFSLYALEEYVPIELTDDDIEEIVKSYNPVFEEAKGVEYSTEERRIGTWIDGKPLYQKTFVCTSPPNIDSSESITSIPSNIAVYNLNGVLVNEFGSFMPIGLYWTPSNYVSAYVDIPNSDIKMRIGATVYSNAPVFITLQYTKTTD